MKKILNIWKISWIHQTAPTKKDIDEIIKKYDFHDLIEDDIMEINTQDKMDVYDNYIFVVMHFPKYNPVSKKYLMNEFDIILWKDFIITLTRFETNHISKIRSEYEQEIKEKDEDEDYKISPYYLLYIMIDVMYDKCIKLLNTISKDILIFEEQLFESQNLNKNILENLMIKRRNMIFLKHNFLPQKDILIEMQEVINKFYEWELEVYFEDLIYKLEKINYQIDIISQNIESLSDTYNSLMNIQTNSIITVLTIFTAITWILTLISWIYWMNITLPWQSNPYFYIILFCVMLLTVFSTLFVFKKKWWI